MPARHNPNREAELRAYAALPPSCVYKENGTWFVRFRHDDAPVPCSSRNDALNRLCRKRALLAASFLGVDPADECALAAVSQGGKLSTRVARILRWVREQ